MLIVMNKHGGKKSNGGAGAKNYLLGKNNDRAHARMLRGDAELTTEIINSLDFSKIYTSGTLAFDYAEGDKLTEQDKQDIIDSFEQTLFPNFSSEQYSSYWVEHTDKKNEKGDTRLELNFVFANVELTTSKALPVYFHRNDVHLTNAWRDVTNATYDLKDPNSADKKRTLSSSKNLPKTVKALRSDMHSLIISEVENGNINNRADIIKTLSDAKIEVVRQTDNSISVKNPDSTKNIRLTGAIYEREFTTEKLVRDYSTSASKQSRQNSIDVNAAAKRLQVSIAKRADRFAQRYKADDSASFKSAQAQNTDRNRIVKSTRYEDKLCVSRAYSSEEHDAQHTYLLPNADANANADDSVSSFCTAITDTTTSQVSHDFFNTIINSGTHTLYNKKKELSDADSRTTNTTDDAENRADATRSSEYSIRETSTAADSFSERFYEQLREHTDAASAITASATDRARQENDSDARTARASYATSKSVNSCVKQVCEQINIKERALTVKDDSQQQSAPVSSRRPRF